MNARERVLRTLAFEPTDRAPYDLMEGAIWPELQDYFRENYGLADYDLVIDYLDPDFRWAWMGTTHEWDRYAGSRWGLAAGPLAEAETERDLDAYHWPDPAWWVPPDYAALRARWPDKALVLCPGWFPLFWTTCDAFGAEAALLAMINRPHIYDAFVQRHHAFCMDILSRSARAAAGICDVALLGDDFASQTSMLISPARWRQHIKPYLAEEVRLLREHGIPVLFHSCGAVRPVLPDLIEIGINGLLVFQTTARGMDAPSIARDFGGRLAFYGGIDVQQLLSFGTPEEVAAEVRANLAAFADCGGYIVANSHHGVSTIRGQNIVAMVQAAKESQRGQI